MRLGKERTAGGLEAAPTKRHAGAKESYRLVHGVGRHAETGEARSPGRVITLGIPRDVKDDAVSSDGSPKGACLFTSAAGNTPERERE